MGRKRKKMTPLFAKYAFMLAVRLVLLATAAWLAVHHPDELDFTRRFGLVSGASFVNVAFVLLVCDLLSKLYPSAKIAMGSRKQYGAFHVPTPRLFKGGIAELTEHAMGLLGAAPSLLRQTVRETAQGMREASRQAALTIDVLRVLPWTEADLTADELLRQDIRRSRVTEIVPVAAFWVIFNIAVGLMLERLSLLGVQAILIWTLFYFLFDMVCVVLWCPLQLVLMRNRCCTTCQIFNWDGIMTVTPLFLVPCPFSIPLIIMALVVLLRWELAFIRHPERFDERTNASLSCANCSDRLCHLRGPLKASGR